MKILIIATCESKHSKINVNLFELDQAIALSALGHEVRIFAYDFRSPNHIRKIGYGNFQLGPVKINHVSMYLGRYIPFKIRTKISVYLINRFFLKLKKSNWQPDVIHTHFIDTTFIFNRVIVNYKMNKNFYFVATEHSSKVHKYKLDGHTHLMVKQAYTNLDLLISVSSSLKRMIFYHTKINSVVVPNMLTSLLDNYSIGDREHFLNRTFTFVVSANLIPIKRIEMQLNAFAVFLKNYESRLVIFGDGKSAKKLKRKCKYLNIEKNVTFKGRKSREYIFDYYKKCDCFLLTSKSETFGVSLIEAMSCGLPVITTASGGPEDIVISDSLGIVIEIDNEVQLINAMESIYKNINYYSPYYIREFVLKRYSSLIISQKLENLYVQKGIKNE